MRGGDQEMKKVVAVSVAILFAFSITAVAFAAETPKTEQAAPKIGEKKAEMPVVEKKEVAEKETKKVHKTKKAKKAKKVKKTKKTKKAKKTTKKSSIESSSEETK
jgi:hypothetical protein